MSHLLIEIGTEELPAGVIEEALSFLKGRLGEILAREDIEVYGTPRRLAFLVRDFEDRREVHEEVVLGPPWKASFDKDGKPTKALEGFLKKHGADLKDVFKATKGRGEYAALRLIREGVTHLQKLSESFEEMLVSVPFPKKMRWSSRRGIVFSRPVRWILALHGEKVLDLSFGELRAGRFPNIHRVSWRRWRI